ncbi:MAG: aminoglycoside phosphotransferase family protein [Candidatus Rifleibacteriota bacterium]
MQLDCKSQQTENKTIAAEKDLMRKIFGLSKTAPVDFNDAGWTSRVYMYNGGEFVAKFPRYEQVKKEYVFEAGAYELVGDNTDIDTPKMVEVGKDYSFIAYQGIVGKTLNKIADLSDTDKARIGAAIGSFLRKFHRFSVSGCNSQTVEDEINECTEKFEMGRSEIARRSDTAQLRIIERFVHTGLPSALTKLGTRMVFSHGDLGYWNMIYQSNGRTGIIDFGDVGYYDESRDFVGLSDETVFNSAISAYGLSNNLVKKAAIRKLVLPIVELPFHIGKNDAAGVSTTIERTHNLLSEYESIA